MRRPEPRTDDEPLVIRREIFRALPPYQRVIARYLAETSGTVKIVD